MARGGRKQQQQQQGGGARGGDGSAGPAASAAAAAPAGKLWVPDDQSNPLAPVIKVAILAAICLMAFSIRLFAVVRWESVIHEFDPYFNFRTTKLLAQEGFIEFLNWFDTRTWYPLGRVVGGTIYPGLMYTASCVYWVLNALNITINVRNTCVFLAPLFAANSAIASYLLTEEVTKRSSTALLAAAFTGIVPSYISRSVGGSYDNEGVAIFALIFTFYLWVKAVNTGSMLWAGFCALAYFYMVAAWGGYVFIINMIPIHTLVILLGGRFTSRLYVAYTTFYSLGTILAMQVPFVGFNVVEQAECAASHGVFVVLNVYVFAEFLRAHMPASTFNRLVRTLLVAAALGTAAFLLFLQLSGRVRWTGRSLSLLDPTYAKKYIPIIASVSEHQPTTWTSFFFDLHILVPFAPVGIFFLYQHITDGAIFVILYGSVAWYFAGVMVRLMLTLAPIACVTAAIGISTVLRKFVAYARFGGGEAGSPGARVPLPRQISIVVIVGVSALLAMFAVHAGYVASEAYSSPSIVIGRKGHTLDDFREAYWWLRQNTPEDSRVMSWWDYGYQMSAMANRTVLVDNNTWNNTHIATVGRALASSEERSYPILRSLDVNYVLLIFGGMTGYSSDDINKFLWFVRIGGGVYPDELSEPDYMAGGGTGGFRIDSAGSPTLLNCVAYKLCFYRFGEMQTDYGKPRGFDRARNVEIGNKDFDLQHFEEAFTSEHWLVRIYKVKDPDIFTPGTALTDGGYADFTPRRPGSVPPGRDALAGAGGSGSSGSNRREQREQREPEPPTQYVGCYALEDDLGSDRVYSGGSTGANFRLARHHAVSQGKRYFAVARGGPDGHAFAFDKLSAQPDSNGQQSCARPCMDDSSKVCGCSDDACVDPPPKGQQNNRRWAVYELSSSGAGSSSSSGAGSSGSSGSKKKKTKKSKSG